MSMRWAGQLAGQVSQTVAAGYIASYGREQELQADGLGAECLALRATEMSFKAITAYDSSAVRV